MFSAISFGVFCRSAPSTSAIMRSRKVEPCAAVMRTLIQSDSTRVPPVTAERSPPLSRMTGADSPVIADSSTEAMPSITSPSLGIRSPASTSTMSPCFSSGAGDRLIGQFESAFEPAAAAWPCVSVRARRSVAACALPRPSATASAKLANSTVTHSQRMIWKVKPRCSPPPVSRSRRKITVVSAATISTTNITGFLIISARVELDERLPDRRQQDRRDPASWTGTRASCCGFPWVSCLCQRGCRRASRSARRRGRVKPPGSRSVRR